MAVRPFTSSAGNQQKARLVRWSSGHRALYLGVRKTFILRVLLFSISFQCNPYAWGTNNVTYLIFLTSYLGLEMSRRAENPAFSFGDFLL